MAQITSGLRSILSNPFIYESFQNIMGINKVRKDFVTKYVSPHNINSFLDIGCGPAEILAFLPKLEYHGFDISESYIENAKDRYGDKGNFYAQPLTNDSLENLPSFDAALMFGVLHHLDDDISKDMIQLSKNALKKGGRLLTIDPAFAPKQNPIARFLASKDRGQNVRTIEEYTSLVDGIFSETNITLHNKSGIPYTFCIMECTKE